MRRKLTVVALLAAAVALVTASVAAAANGGFSPENAHSPNTHATNTTYWIVFAFTSVIFVLVEGALVAFIIKYRARGRSRTEEGIQLHGNTRFETIWTIIPILILAVIAAVVFIELPNIKGPSANAADSLQITVEGHQFYWQFDYPNGARSINDLHVPVGTQVDLKVISSDVVHSWWIPQLAGKLQAIPGRTNHTWFKADRAGTYYGQCAELCGPFHAVMRASVIAESQADYQAFVSGKAVSDLGRQEFQGVCATCHGMQGQGGYGPALANNSLLTQQSALTALVKNGRGLMPPVGNTWNAAQLKALIAYTKAHIYKGGSTSGG